MPDGGTGIESAFREGFQPRCPSQPKVQTRDPHESGSRCTGLNPMPFSEWNPGGFATSWGGRATAIGLLIRFLQIHGEAARAANPWPVDSTLLG